MVFSVSPSVIVREVDATAVIPAIATPPAAIAGVFRWGPTNERILITSEDDLAARFGKPFANTTWQNFETFFSAADFLSYSNALYVTRVTSDDAATAVGTYFSAKYPGDIGNSLQVAISSAASFEDTIADVGEATGTFAFNANTVTANIDVAITTPLQEDDIIRIGNPTIGYQDLIVSTFADTSANSAPFDYTITFKNRYVLAETDLNQLSIERKWGYANQVAGAPANSSLVHISVIDEDGVISGTAGSVLEIYENVSVNSNARLPDGTTNYYVDVLANRSAWIKAIGTGDGDNIPSTALTGSFAAPIYESLTGGSDGIGEAAVPFGKIALGYDLYKDANEVDISGLICGKSSNANLANYITQNIAEARKDCVVYASPAYSDVVAPANPATKTTNAITFRNNCTSSSYLVIDSGYKYRYDKYNDVYRWVPLNGDIAGLAARVEPWESPAGYKRGVIKNVVKLAFNPNKAQRDQLYGSDVNPVISQVGQGVLLFGDKTALGTATGSAFTRINVRRLFITVEKAIATVAASFLFDFNDEFTQTQFKNLVEPFLRDIQGRRGIIDFRVVSDATVNTPDIIDRNIFRGNIFIKPARSINVIELTFVATRTGIEFDEIVGQPL
jgi:hypothetical protein